MTWTTPRTWVAGETVTAAMMNSQIRDNLNVLSPLGDITALTGWSPSLTAATTNPNVGSTGSVTGQWLKLGAFTFAQFAVKFLGTGISAGAGIYFLNLPIVPSAVQPVSGIIGSAAFYDSSGPNLTGYDVKLENVSGLLSFQKIDGAGGLWTATSPAAPATGDTLTGFVMYAS